MKDLHVERAALFTLMTAILTSDGQDMLLFQQLSPEHFFDPLHKALFMALYEAYSSHRELTTLGNIDDLTAEPWDDYRWLDYLHKAPYIGAPYQLVARLNEMFALREAHRFKVQDDGDIPEQFISKGRDLKDILSDPSHVTDEQILERLSQKPVRVPTGYGDMDTMLGGGIENGALFAIAARTGLGKTTLATNIASRALKAGKTVFFLTLEMPEEGIYARLLQTHKGFTQADVRAKAKSLSLGNAFRVAMPSARLPKILKVLSENAHHDLIIIDYFGLISAPGDNHAQQLETVSNELKRFALEFRKPVIILAQLNRNIESDRVNREPELSDIRSCGALEQDAHTVTFLWDKNAKDEQKPAQRGSSTTKIPDYWWIVRKNRNGPCGKLQLAFDTSTMTFTSLLPDL
jgi:replicative DNA helicase